MARLRIDGATTEAGLSRIRFAIDDVAYELEVSVEDMERPERGHRSPDRLLLGVLRGHGGPIDELAGEEFEV